MFTRAESEQIGAYFTKLAIAHSGNQRQFCIAWLEAEHTPVNNETLKSRENKFSQIKKGKNDIPVNDLLLICGLLHISCEELLSAGEVFKPDKDRLTNYLVAFSKDEKIWEEYINHPDKLILNPDEYCRTVIDYALQFKNFELIKYLIDRKYIWFDSGSPDRKTSSYRLEFGAGTSIKGRNIAGVDYYMPQQLCNKQLRMRLIAFAIECGSLEILKEMVAREFPYFYHVTFYSRYVEMEFEDYYNPDVISKIGQASDEIVRYFTDEFELQKELRHEGESERKYLFMYPFITEVLNELVIQGHGSAEAALRKAIGHNRTVYEKLKENVRKAVAVKENYNYSYVSSEQMYREKLRSLNQYGVPEELYKGFYKDYEEKIIRFRKNAKRDCLNRVLGDITFSEKSGFVSLTTISGDKYLKFISNIAHVTKEPKDIKTKQLIEELNCCYEKIIHIADEFRREMK